MHKSRFLVGIRLVSALMVVSCIGSFPRTLAQTNGHGRQNGMILPRPVDSKLRAALGMGAPRPADVILQEIDAIQKQMPAFQEDPKTYGQTKQQRRELIWRRIDLVSELEESGYKGPRLAALLEQKLKDINYVWDRSLSPVTAYSDLRREIIERHGGEPIAAKAEVDELMEVIHIITLSQMHVAAQDYDRIAKAELARRDDPMAGLLLLEALHFERDPSFVAKWYDWITNNLGPSSEGYRFVIRKRTFGMPVRLEGVGFDGEKIDTAEWKGDVVLVDFWGLWCSGCVEALPKLKRMHDKYNQRGLRIVGVLCDERIDKARALLREKGYEWPEMVDRSLTPENNLHPIASKYGVTGFPTLWIVDRKGVLREEGDVDKLEEQISKFLGEPVPLSNKQSIGGSHLFFGHARSKISSLRSF
jgi:thiol-disulfide isomerase/thioredoxin